MNTILHIHHLIPAHSETHAWVMGRVVALKKGEAEIEMLLEDHFHTTPLWVSLPLREPFLSLLPLAKPSFFIGVYGQIAAQPLGEGPLAFLYQMTGELFCLWNPKGEEVLLSPAEKVLLPCFNKCFTKTTEKKSPYAPLFLPPARVMETAREAKLFFTLKEVQLLCYKLFSMVDFTSLVLQAPLPHGAPVFKDAPYPLREDASQALFTSQEILSATSQLKGPYFTVPAAFLAEDV